MFRSALSIRDALDRAMAVSHAPGDLSRMLKLYGYRLSAPENRKYVTICAINGGKLTRLYQLGEDYSLARMQVRIRQNSYTVQIEQPRYQKITTTPQKMRCRGSLLRCRKITGFQALYIHYLFLLGIVPKGRHKPLSPALREDLRRLDRYVAQHRFLCRERLNTVEDVTEFAQNKRVMLADKCGQREHCYNRLRRCAVPEEVDSFKAQGELSYFRLYTAFFQDPRYAALRLESKVLYGVFLSRHSLSAQNGWRDPGGRTFFYCTIAEACRLLGCKRSKAMAGSWNWSDKA